MNQRTANSKQKRSGPVPTVDCCRIESVVTIDDRGQMVLPKEVRRRAGIKPGDRLAIVTPELCGPQCCILLVKADAFATRARELLGPLLEDVSEGPDAPSRRERKRHEE